MGVFCRGDWTDVGELGGECAGESEGGESEGGESEGGESEGGED